MKIVRHKVSRTRRMGKKKSRARNQIKLIKGGVNHHMETIQDNIMRATIVEGQYAEDIRQALLRKPSPTALLRNQRASALLKKLRK